MAFSFSYLGGESSSTNSSCYGSTQNLATTTTTTATTATFRGTLKIVNPNCGTVTTINDDLETVSSHNSTNQLHENCDETLFRPFVTVISDETSATSKENEKKEICNTNILQNAKLIVPIYDQKEVTMAKKSKSESQKPSRKERKEINTQKEKRPPVLRETTKEEERIKKEEPKKIVESVHNLVDLETNTTKSTPEIVIPLNVETSYKIQEDLLKSNVENTKAPEEEISDPIDDVTDKFSLDLKFPSLEPLDPIENFVDTYDKLNTEEEEEVKKTFEPDPKENVWNDFSQKKLIFAMCTSLRDDEETRRVEPAHESQDSDYKSLETEEKITENPPVETEAPQSEDTTSTGSDDNTEENSGVLSDKPREEDDEELRPLINNRRKDISEKSLNNLHDTNSVQTTPTHNSGNSKRKARRKRK